jgi:hypothetical protein
MTMSTDNLPEEKTLNHCFDARGWHVQRALLDYGDVERLRLYLQTRFDVIQKAFEAWSGVPVNDKTPYGWHQKKLSEYEARKIPRDFRNFLVGQFDLETRLDLRVVDLLSTSACQAFLKEFLKSPRYYIHFPPMLRFKFMEAPESQVPVHQDIAYNQHLSDFVTLWAPLTEINETCGGVIVYEGSHRAEVFQHESSGAWANRARVEPLEKYPSKHILMEKGDVLLFPPTLLHESALHQSSTVRYSIDYRIFLNKEETSKSYYDPAEKRVIRID